jgi:hypothetical protein
MTTDRLKSSRIVEHSVSTHGEQIAAKLAERAQGLPGDFSALDFLAVLLFLQALQTSARQQLAAADEAHRNEIANDDGVREERDAAGADLGAIIQAQRDGFRAAFGPTKAKELGFDVRLGRNDGARLAQGKRLLAKLDPEKPLPVSRIPGVSVDLGVRPAIEAAVTRLETALENVADEKTKADATQVAKDFAMKEFDATFLRVGRTLEALYTLAGALDLAARVRPSRRRPGRTETVGEEPDPGQGEPEPGTPPVGFQPPVLIP